MYMSQNFADNPRTFRQVGKFVHNLFSSSLFLDPILLNHLIDKRCNRIQKYFVANFSWPAWPISHATNNLQINKS